MYSHNRSSQIHNTNHSPSCQPGIIAPNPSLTANQPLIPPADPIPNAYAYRDPLKPIPNSLLSPCLRELPKSIPNPIPSPAEIPSNPSIHIHPQSHPRQNPPRSGSPHPSINLPINIANPIPSLSPDPLPVPSRTA